MKFQKLARTQNPLASFSRAFLLLPISLAVFLATWIDSTASPQHEFHGASPIQWSVRMANSQIERLGDQLSWQESRKSKWDYTTGLFTLSLLKLNENIPNPAYVDYTKETIGSFINPDGTIRNYHLEDYNIDNIAPGKTVIALYEITREERYKKCADLLRQQLASQPRTREGGFWHKQRYPSQMWLDGLFMAAPFYAEYTIDFHGPAADLDDVIQQFRLIHQHLYDSKSGLYWHAWDEKLQQDWADKTTGRSANFWARGLGWWLMAQVDTLDFLPDKHPGRAEIIQLIQGTCTGVLNHQDPTSGLWWQVLDQGKRRGNYLESTSSAMFVYSMAKAVNRGHLTRDSIPAIIKGYEGIIRQFIKTEAGGEISLTQCCAVAGLGYGRDGSYEYYLSEPIVDNDLKGIGPFILAGIELQKLLGLPMNKTKPLN